MENKGSQFYYSRLCEGEKRLYEKIYGALERHEPALSIHSGVGRPFAFDIERVMNGIIFDNPIFFYLNRERVIIKQTPFYIQLIFNYDYEKDEADRLWGEITKKADEFIADKINTRMSALAKQLEIHRYVTKIKPAQKPFGKESYSLVGAFLNDSCVCEGYSKAYKLLCDKAGIASIVVLGDALLPDGTREKHAWNITRINGVVAHTDATWDAQYGISNYDYFNLCDADISADHSFDPEKYPECAPNKINYFYKNGLIAFDEAELESMISAHAADERFSVRLMFGFDFSSIHKLPFGKGNVRYNPAQNIISYTKN